MKKTIIVSMLINIIFSSCTTRSTTLGVLDVVLDTDITNHELFDADCVASNVILDSFYLNENTNAMLPYHDVNTLRFKNENREVVEFYSEQGEQRSFRETEVERYCVNADNEWSIGSEVSENLKIYFKGVLPSGEELKINGFMHKEKTWFADQTKTRGRYDSFIVYIATETYKEARVSFVPWKEAIVNQADIDTPNSGALHSSISLAGQDYSDVYVSQSQNSSNLKIYVKEGIGVIAFATQEGELFVLE